jgi:hypothetical protein
MLDNSVMDKTYHALPFSLKTQRRYLLYIVNDKNSFVSNNGVIETYSSRDSLCQRAIELGFQIVPTDWSGLDLNKLHKWLSKPTKKRISCVRFLNLWNIFDDFATQLHLEFDPNHIATQNVYDKLFFGSNMPSVTPKGQFYAPIWSDDEVEQIQRVLEAGLQMFQEYQFILI